MSYLNISMMSFQRRLFAAVMIFCMGLQCAKATTIKVNSWKDLQAQVAAITAAGTSETIEMGCNVNFSGSEIGAILDNGNDKTLEFKGTIDFGGHSISNGVLTAELFDFLNGATIKNLVLEDISGTPTTSLEMRIVCAFLADCCKNSTFDNITFRRCHITNCCGLLSSNTTNCKVMNIVAEDCSIDGKSEAGGLIRYANATTITDCRLANMSIHSELLNLGGYVGLLTAHSSITNCTISGHVWQTDARLRCGGFVGFASASTITDCINYAEVESDNDKVGGIVGDFVQNGTSATISNCTNYGYIHHTDLDGHDDVLGGIVGYLEGYVTGCVNNGRVDAGDCQVGGIAGEMAAGGISYCLNTAEINGDDHLGALVGNMESGTSMMYCLSTGSIDTESSNCVGGRYGGRDSNTTVAYTYNRYDAGTFDTSNAEGGVVTATQLKSGELACFMNTKSGTTNWGQRLKNDGSAIDLYPVPDGPEVYKHEKSCMSDNTVFYNNNETNHIGELTTINGELCCDVCHNNIYDESIVGSAFVINSADDLAQFAAYVSGNATLNSHPTASAYLTRDIDCSGITWTPLGTESSPYCGTFNGQGHALKNLTVSVGDAPAGLFAYVGNGAVIENLIMDASCSVTSSGTGVAAFAGRFVANLGTTISLLTIRNCGNEATITGTRNVAAILGAVFSDQTKLVIDHCYNTGAINGESESAAICAWANTNFTIKSTWNSGEVKGLQSADRKFYRCAESITDCSMADDYCVASGGQANVENILSEDVSSGSLCYKLNGSQDGQAQNGWYQLLGLSSDGHPSLRATSAGLVYAHTNYYCTDPSSTFTVYTNDDEQPEPIHSYDDNGFCDAKTGETHYEKPEFKDKYYLIRNAGNLYWFAAYVNSEDREGPLNCRLLNDIVVNENLFQNGYVAPTSNTRAWTPIGTERYPYIAYDFDGNGHTISGLYLRRNASFGGLFGVACYGATIHHVGVIDSYLYGICYSGAIVGCGFNDYDMTETTGAIIHACYSTGVISSESGRGYAGGIAGGLNQGDSYSSNLSDCYSLCKVVDGYRKGSLFGILYMGSYDVNYTGNLNRCFYQVDKNTGITANKNQDYGTPMSAFSFKSGEVCDLLNQGDYEWNMRLDNDAYPTLGDDGIQYTRRVSSEWGTIVLPYAIASDEAVQLYEVVSCDVTSDATTGRVTLKPVDQVAANTPCFFRRLNDETASICFAADPDGFDMYDGDYESITSPILEDAGWSMVGSYNSLSDLTDVYYLAQDKLWYAEESIELPAYRAYMTNEDQKHTCKSLSLLVLDDEGDVDEIVNVNADTNNEGACYNLAGQRVSNSAKGIVIKNGIKYLNK